MVMTITLGQLLHGLSTAWSSIFWSGVVVLIVAAVLDRNSKGSI